MKLTAIKKRQNQPWLTWHRLNWRVFTPTLSGQSIYKSAQGSYVRIVRGLWITNVHLTAYSSFVSNLPFHRAVKCA